MYEPNGDPHLGVLRLRTLRTIALGIVSGRDRMLSCNLMPRL
jgi:hypothetical protein